MRWQGTHVLYLHRRCGYFYSQTPCWINQKCVIFSSVFCLGVWQEARISLFIISYDGFCLNFLLPEKFVLGKKEKRKKKRKKEKVKRKKKKHMRKIKDEILVYCLPWWLLFTFPCERLVVRPEELVVKIGVLYLKYLTVCMAKLLNWPHTHVIICFSIYSGGLARENILMPLWEDVFGTSWNCRKTYINITSTKHQSVRKTCNVHKTPKCQKDISTKHQNVRKT